MVSSSSVVMELQYNIAMRENDKTIRIAGRVFTCDDVLFDGQVLNGTDEQNIEYLLDRECVEE